MRSHEWYQKEYEEICEHIDNAIENYTPADIPMIASMVEIYEYLDGKRGAKEQMRVPNVMP